MTQKITFAEIRKRVPGLLVEDWGDNVHLSPPPPEDWMSELIELPPPRYDVKSTEDWDEELDLIEDWSSGPSEPTFSLTTGVCKPKWRNGALRVWEDVGAGEHKRSNGPSQGQTISIHKN
ncbi:hypothetical protein ACF0H5_020872 [Mactra antiquata]